MPTKPRVSVGIPRRPFGRGGEPVSALALGGYHLGTIGNRGEATRIIHAAIDAGITFMDNAWEYHEGESEEIMGKALAGRRDQVFLMSKVCTHGRDRTVAMRQLRQSLKRLETDHLDLWQVHEVVYPNDPERHFAPGGVIEALVEAKEKGLVRYVGFTGHKLPEIHLEMLSHEFPFDSVQMPLNCFDASFRSFELHVLPNARRQGLAVLGMKSMGGEGDAVRKRVLTAEEALRYAMSLPVTTTVTGIDSMRVLRQNVRIASDFVPMLPDEMSALRARVATYAADGRFELYKSTAKHEGDVGRKQHGFPGSDDVAA
ncbi:MAG TPA: aldo/keto reductase [Gemmatimonadaceae bacterium]|nr:aldo/keto reductase [Gemmatimonadaceae bacterium]